MTTYRNGLTCGSGLFTDSKYPGERHVPGFQYLGPWTRTDIRLDENYKPRAGEEIISKLDNIALIHDIAYSKAKKNMYKITIKQKH